MKHLTIPFFVFSIHENFYTWNRFLAQINLRNYLKKFSYQFQNVYFITL